MARRFALAPGILLALALLLWPRAVAGSPTRAPLDSTPVGTSFTYQGELKQSGAPVNGTCDIQFSLFDALTGGTQIGSTQTIGGVSVANGLFTVGLEFGPGAFNGDARWLQIAPACPPGSGFTTLTPRQALTPSPYAIFAPNIPLAGSGTATTAARSDHDHFGQSWIGASSSPGLVLQNTSTVAGIRGLSVRQGGPNVIHSGDSVAVYGESANGDGLVGFSDTRFGVVGFSRDNMGVNGGSTNGTGVVGNTSAVSGAGVKGQSSTAGSPALQAQNTAAGGMALEIAQGGIKVTGAGVGSSTPAFVHQATAANQCGIFAANDGTILTNPFADGTPSALVMVTPVGGPNYIRKAVTVTYNSGSGTDPICGVGHWLVYTLDGTSILNTSYNVLVIRP